MLHNYELYTIQCDPCGRLQYMLYIIMMTNILAPSITWFLQVRSGQDALVRYGMVYRNGGSGK